MIQLEEEFELPEKESVVYLTDEQVFGIIVKQGAYVSVVQYSKDGISYEVVVENDDIL